jgi:methylenetetrahydrofolate dehydrogenase (NADP+)/methenyltetrahydrofolate cyclohydrolase
MAKRMDIGKIIEKQTKDLQEKLKRLKDTRGIIPTLYIISVETENQGGNIATEKYINNKRKKASEIGLNTVHKHIPLSTPTEEKLSIIKETIDICNSDTTKFCILQLPISEDLKEYEKELLDSINDITDVDGLSEHSTLHVPCTVKGILTLIDEYKLDIKEAVVVGRGKTVGKPLREKLESRGIKVFVIHSKTDLDEFVREHPTTDLLVAAIPTPIDDKIKSIKVRESIIDVGIMRDEETNKLRGCVSEEDKEKSSARYYSPVPGGVGRLTVISLMDNVVETFKLD